ncbi:MAG: RdgB/HAM1 family non-canonical purine NTP pyrophosphatase [bacterium]|nr:RdgB/HAM1 family non-canonical purine NTP pyrophosphatase [bacterium]
MIWVIGTTNPNKFSEIVHILNSLPVQFMSISNWNVIEPEEIGTSLLENAQIKSRYYHRMTKQLCIADDTGLFVEALNGEPGIYAARYAGENSTYKENRVKLIERLKPYPQPWRAYFETVISITWKDGEWHGSGIAKGRIIPEERGSLGFGYDPIFIPDGWNKTFAEMSELEKNSISHRYLALIKILDAVSKNRIPIY